MKYGFILICFLHITSALAGQGVKKNRAKSDFDIFLFKVSGKYFYVDRKIVKDKKAEDILRDSSLRFYELLFYKTDSNLAILTRSYSLWINIIFNVELPIPQIKLNMRMLQ
jgi:hypothetical protein